MNKLDILRIRLIQTEEGWREAPSDVSDGVAVWPSFGFFVSNQTGVEQMARLTALAPTFGCGLLPSPDGVLVHGEYDKLERLASTLTK